MVSLLALQREGERSSRRARTDQMSKMSPVEGRVFGNSSHSRRRSPGTNPGDCMSWSLPKQVSNCSRITPNEGECGRRQLEGHRPGRPAAPLHLGLLAPGRRFLRGGLVARELGIAAGIRSHPSPTTTIWKSRTESSRRKIHNLRRKGGRD